jgi:plastocyanin
MLNLSKVEIEDRVFDRKSLLLVQHRSSGRFSNQEVPAMRFGSLLLTALSAMIAVSTTSGSAQACCCGWGGWGYRPAYYYPQPMYYGPSMSNMPSRPMPGMAPSQTKSVAVNIKDDKFDPGNITIQPGTAVRFTNNGKHIHTVTAGDGRWDSRDIPPGQTFTVIFMAPGTYKYHCRHHKGMEGTITVGQPGKGKGKATGASAIGEVYH